jgi:hypothetical protein
MTNIPIVNEPISYVSGIGIKYINSDTLLQLNPGSARDSTNTNDIIINETLFLNNRVQGANGRDVLGAANHVYAVYVIGDSTSYLPSSGILSLDFVSPALPAGYDMFRRIGSVFIDSLIRFSDFLQVGTGEQRTMYISPFQIILSGTSTTFVGIVPAVQFIPPFADTKLGVSISFTPAAATNIVELRPFGTIFSSGSAIFGGYSAAASQRGQLEVGAGLSLNGYPIIEYRVSGGSVSISISSYVDVLTTIKDLGILPP